MSDTEKAPKDSSPDLIRYMHDVAGRYHNHFSTVRTTATTLVLPIGLVASTQLLATCKATQLSVVWSEAFVCFIVVASLALNMLFTRWSRACRHLERYYESLMTKNETQFNPTTHGFRNLFRRMIKYDASFTFPTNLAYIRKGKGSIDPFVLIILTFGIVYLIGYGFAYASVCQR